MTNIRDNLHRILSALLLALTAGAAQAAPGDILYQQTFEDGGGACTLGGWTLDGGNPQRAGSSTDTADTNPCSLFTQRDDVIVTGPSFDAAVPAADLEVWVRRGGNFGDSEYPDAGDDIELQYLDDTGNWTSLETFQGGGTAGEVFERAYRLDAGALHSGLRVRVVATGADGDGFDYWHVDTVTVTERQPAYVGSGTGLHGDYCNRDGGNETVPCDSNPDTNRIDSTVDFRTGDSDWPASGIDPDTFSVRWTGQVQAQYTEDYTFHALHDDGVRIWVDGTLVIDDYVDQDDNWSDSGTPLALERGQKYDIVIEYYENGGEQDMVLGWSSASTPLRTVIPESQLYPPAAPSANLLAAYRFDETAWDGTSGEVVDASGNGRDGTAQGGADTALSGSAIGGDPGTCGYGTFDGSDDYVSVPNLSDTLDGTATLAFWVRTSQTGNDTAWQAPGIAGVEESGGADDIFWGWIDGSGRIGISAGNDYEAEQKSTTAINDGTWHHVALTRDASGGETRVYVDGALESTGTTPTGVIGTAFESIGRIEDTAGSPEYFDGDLDEVRIYDGVLDEDAVEFVRDLTHPCPFQCGPGGQFSDGFEDGTLAPWQRQGGPPSRAGVSEATAADGSHSMFLRHDTVRVRSPVVDLSGAASASLSAWVRRGGDSFGPSEPPEAGENLVLEYHDSGGTWQALQTFPGGDPPGEIFEPGYALPAAALHADFRIRFRLTGGSGDDFDYWHVDNVCLTTSGGGVDHFALAHDGAGINCRSEDVVLRAEDGSGNLVTGYTGSVDLSTSTSNGDWAIGTGNGSLSGGGGDDGAATYSFVSGDGGEVTLAFSNTHAETLNIGATDGSATDDDTEGGITFRPWGFEFNPDPIPTQVAGRPFALGLTAVGELPSDPGCNVIEEYDGDRDVKFWFDYEDPGSGTVDVTVDGTAIESSSAAATAQTVTFTGGTATVPVDYRDAGEIQLHARDDTGVGEPPSGGGDELVSGGAIGGGTNPFVVRPFGFYIDFDPDNDNTYDDRASNTGCGAQTSCAADAAGDVFATAGADFSARIAAVVYQSADDGDSDGRPDANAILGDNDATPNFGQESAAEKVDLADTLVAPSPGTAGTLANATAISGFTGGARTVTNLRYSEVGIIDLDATLSNGAYLGTEDVTGAVANVGRFIPADFAVAVRDAGMYAATCNATFTYVGQAFGYDMRPLLDITARNAGGATTRNYRAGFIKLTGADVDVTPPTRDASAVGNVSGTTDVAVTPSLNAGAVADDGDGGALGDGTIVYTFDDGDRYTYDRVHNARIAPFDNDLPITLDGVTDGDGVSEDAGGSVDSFTPTAVELHFGRLVLDDAFGPEVAPVEQRWRIEAWQGANWARNVGDGCTSLALASDVQLDGDSGTQPGDATVTLNDSGGTGATAIVDNALDVSGGAIGFTSGTAAVRYAAPGEGERGWIGVSSTLGAGHHLLIDDNDDGGEDGPYDTNPSARVTFGVFAGESENIYLREVFPAP